MGKASVLIIDDETSILKATQIAMKDQEIEVHLATNGQEGLAMVHRVEPVVIVLDLQMPAMNGFQFLETLQPKPEDPYGVVILTGNYSDEDMQRCFDLGCYFFLRKPFGKVEICCLVNRCIAMKRLEANERRYREQLEEQVARHFRPDHPFHQPSALCGATPIPPEKVHKLSKFGN